MRARTRRSASPIPPITCPIIYGMLGIKVEKLGDMAAGAASAAAACCLRRCAKIHPLPYLAPALDAGMATLFAEEIIEAIRYLETARFLYQNGGHRWTTTSGWAPPMTSS